MNKFKMTLLFLCTAVSAFSEIILDVSNTLPNLREPFQASIEFIDIGKKNYTIEGIDNFEILSRGSTNKYYSYNGKTTSSKTDTYILKAKKAGKFKLQVVNGKERSNDILVNVSSGGNQVVQNEKFFISSKVPKKEYYFGQKIPFEEIFTSTVNLRTFDILKRPEFQGFSAKDITPQNNGSLIQKKTRINGKEAFEVILYQGILQANSSGEKFIRAGEAEVREDDFNTFSSMTLPKYVGNQETKIDILPLPDNKPTGFQDIVGTLKGEYKWSGEKVEHGQAITLNIRFFGDVNLDLLEKILPPGSGDRFNIYESIKGTKEEILKDGNYWAEKSFEIAFVPKESGAVDTPEIKIPYFDTENKKYEYYIIPSHRIEVGGNIKSSPVTASAPNQPQGDRENITPAPSSSNDITILPKGELPVEKIAAIGDGWNYKLISISLGVFCIFQGLGFMIFLWKRKKPKDNRKKNFMDQLKRSKNDKDFYENYCRYLKDIYDFSPKAHSEDRFLKNGASPELIGIHREVQKNIYSNIPLNRKNIIKILKESSN